MTDKGKPFAQDGYMRTPRIVTTEGKAGVENGYRPTPTVTTSQGQSQGGSGDKK